MSNKLTDQAKPAYYNLTTENELDSEIEFDRKNHEIDDWLEVCEEIYRKIRKKFRQGHKASWELLQEIYNLALSSHHSIDELRTIAKDKDLKFNKRTDIFAFYLKLIYGDDGSKRRKISEHANALQYLYYEQVSGDDIAEQLKERGGIRECANSLAEIRRSYREDSTEKKSDDIASLWNDIKPEEPLAVYKATDDEPIHTDRCIIVAYLTEKGNMRIYKVIDAEDDIGPKILKIVDSA